MRNVDGVDYDVMLFNTYGGVCVAGGECSGESRVGYSPPLHSNSRQAGHTTHNK